MGAPQEKDRPMRFSVETWDPAYGAPGEAVEFEESSGDAVVDVEVPAGRWAPLPVPASDGRNEVVVFVDGVRRVDARAWVHTAGGGATPAICATYAAGAVRCDGGREPRRAELATVLVERGFFTPAPEAADVVTRSATYPVRTVGSSRVEALPLALQARMGELEVTAAEAAGGPGCDLLVVDGPLKGRSHVPGAIGYVKTHHVAYLPPAEHAVVDGLGPGQRTPVFSTGTAFPRYAWYLRLPGAGATPWAGVVRCEAPAGLDPAVAVALADRASSTLGRFASEAHKDPRAPQNLYPIAGLERELRRRLGNEAVLYRALRLAAA